MTVNSQPKRTGQLGLAVVLSVLVLALAACGSRDDGIPAEVALADTAVSADYVVESQTCPPGFSLARNSAGSTPTNFTISDADGGGSRFVGGADGIEVDCVSDTDGDAFPFNASNIEFTVSPAEAVEGTATWSDSVGLSMNALISGSAGVTLHEIVLSLTAPNGDTLSEMSLASQCLDCDLNPSGSSPER